MTSIASVAPDAPRIRSLSETAIRSALAQHNPDAPRNAIAEVAKMIVAFSRAVAKLSAVERQSIPLAEHRLRQILLDAGRLAADSAPEQIPYEKSGPIEHSTGEGLGDRISLDDGMARLADYAPRRPIESWAGPVAGAGEIEAELGIPRSTLNEWHRRGSVVGLLRGERKRVYPLEQFVDARPLKGIAAIVRMAPDARAAWLWLRQPHGSLDMQIPLHELGKGRIEQVVAAAERDFG